MAILPVDNILREAAALASSHDAALSAAAEPSGSAPQELLMTFAIGTPVLDLVTGERGVVIDGKRESVIVSAA